MFCGEKWDCLNYGIVAVNRLKPGGYYRTPFCGSDKHRILPVCLCILCVSHSKHQLLPYTHLTGLSLECTWSTYTCRDN